MPIQPEPYDPQASESLLVCSACGTQFASADRNATRTCFICDDPRQYVPPSGQSFTTLADLRRTGHRNVFKSYDQDSRLTFISSEPRIGIGQRAILVRTGKDGASTNSNVLWDCVTLLDDDTIRRIRELGGLAAIVISHPHFYSAHVEWARAFGCPVYLSGEDRQWLARSSSHQVFLSDVETEIGEGTGVRAIKLGGHFPGSMVLLFDGRLLIADTLYTVPAGTSNWDVDALGSSRDRPQGVNTFSFLWSIPNAVPLSPDEIIRMWSILKKYDFKSTHGGFFPQDIEDARVKHRVLESMKIQMRAMGWKDSPLLAESLDG